jgi:hypothetical protein
MDPVGGQEKPDTCCESDVPLSKDDSDVSMRNAVAASPTKRRPPPSQARLFSRRAVLILATGAGVTRLLSAAAPSLAGYAHAAAKLPRVGLLTIGSLKSPESKETLEAMRQGYSGEGPSERVG